MLPSRVAMIVMFLQSLFISTAWFVFDLPDICIVLPGPVGMAIWGADALWRQLRDQSAREERPPETRVKTEELSDALAAAARSLDRAAEAIRTGAIESAPRS